MTRYLIIDIICSGSVMSILITHFRVALGENYIIRNAKKLILGL